MANPSIDAGHHVWPPKGLVGLLVLGLAALFSSLLIYSGTVIGFLRFPVFGASAAPVGFMALFAETTLLAGTVIAAAFIAGTVRRREPVSFMVLGTVSAITYLCCSLGFGFACYFAVTVPLVYPLLGVVVALSDCGMALVWGRVCSHRLAMRAALLVVGLAAVASAIICLLYSWLPQEGMLALFFVCSAVAVVVPLAVYEPHSGNAVAGEGAPRSDLSDEEREHDRSRAVWRKRWHTAEVPAAAGRLDISALFDVAGTSSLGLVCFAFAMAVMRTQFNESQSAYLSALILSGAGIAAYAVLKRRRFLLPGGLQQTFLPVLAMVVLAATSITATLDCGALLSDWLTYALYSLAAVLTLATLCAVAHAGEFSSDLVFSTALCAFCGASFIGQQVGGALPDEMVSIAVTISTTVYAFALVLVSYLRRRSEVEAGLAVVEETPNQNFSRVALASDAPASKVSSELGGVTSSDSLAARVTALAECHGLTAREREILGYLAEGHNGAYIASVLFISPNTARTHIHNIYRKMDVSSREDILRLTR